MVNDVNRSDPGPIGTKPIPWEAVQISAYEKAILDSNHNDCDNCILLAFYHDSKIDIDLSLPHWLIFSEGNKYQRDNLSMMNIVRDTLMEYEPKVCITYSSTPSQKTPTRVKGRLTRLLHSNELTTIKKGDRTYYMWMYISLDAKYDAKKLPTDICNIGLKFKATSLPLEKYMYGHCLKFDARYLSCPFSQYLRVGGSQKSEKGVGKDVCRVFRLDKGSPHIYCSFLLGT
jgi:hypothetical protein